MTSTSISNFSIVSNFPSFSQLEDTSETSISISDSYILEPLPSSVKDLLKTNEAPLHSKLLQSNLHDAENMLLDLNVQLEKMKAEIALFTVKRNQLVTMIETYRNILHPIRRTPPEVLLEIFSYCVEFVDTDHPRICQNIDSLDTKQAPWSLAQVCKYWRFVVLECPRLWSSLSLDLARMEHKDPAKAQELEYNAIALLSHYLRRSKDCPLTIAVHSTRPMHPIVSLICSHSGRWSNVLLSLPPEGFRLLSTIKGCLPKLKALHLRNVECLENIWNAMPVIDAFEYAPNLRMVRAYEIPNIASKLLLPWDQITHCMNNFPTGDVLFRDSLNRQNMDILTKGVKLRHVALFCSGYGPSLVLKNLKHQFLTAITIDLIRNSNLDLLNQLLNALTLPSLASLRISVSSRLRVRPNVEPIVRLLERSDCALVKLRLKGFETDMEEDSHFRSLLYLIQNSMQVLCLEYFPTSLLSALIVTEDQAPFLPRLRHLRLSGVCSPQMDQLLFVKMLESRMKYPKFMVLEMSSHFILTNQEAQRQLDQLDIITSS
ncbi:hypothetical protein C8J55DRAFT_37355 [Lentinula edodes]|uniref:F-box domain-containing protein n=1 Tax=Lentinula lateritia TaxID=40482 RepID=A0A9W9DT25_9AGAR|nr:hypothetical protein C8J55DRAFT_37355 [Lentinula edodes]